jgi:heparan-alpha-glucosaminide N-acetyltransferase
VIPAHRRRSISVLLQEPSVAPAGQSVSSRIASIDVFRGFTMLVMIFVNDLSSVKGLPWWNYHMPEEANGMTYVDMVFPAFLFILGMSIPLAAEQRLSKAMSMGQLWWHVVLRTMSLLVLGLVLANAGKGDSALMGLDNDVWTSVALIGAVLFWNVYGRSERYGTLFRILKFSGLVLIVAMFAIFRRTAEHGHAAWIDTSYWEILGLIGWTYLAVSILYIPTRRFRWAPLGWFVALLLLNVLTSAKWITFPDRLPLYVWPFESGALASIAMAGVVTSTIFLRESRTRTFRDKAIPALLFSGTVLALGWILTPLGVSKIRATPSWCLYSVGSSLLPFTALFWICDVKKRTAWATLLRPAGANTLLTYLLPDLYYSAFGSFSVDRHFDRGGLGVAKSVVFTGIILGVSAVLTKWKVRLQL